MTTLVVVAAVIEHAGAFLLTRRQAGVHMAGCWEFPGGKCEPGEGHVEGLVREIREELGADVSVGPELFATSHEYPDRRVELHFRRCDLRGAPTPQLGQEMRWVPRAELAALEFPPADVELVARLVRGA
jgi:8-oxo-dGTP diphosphatase